MEQDKFQVTITSVAKLGCSKGYKGGETWVFDSSSQAPADICSGPCTLLATALEVLRSGGSFPWDKDKNTTCVVCPDRTKRITFEIKRLSSAPEGLPLIPTHKGRENKS